LHAGFAFNSREASESETADASTWPSRPAGRRSANPNQAIVIVDAVLNQFRTAGDLVLEFFRELR